MRIQDYLKEMHEEDSAEVRLRLRTLAMTDDLNNQMWSNLLAEERFTRHDCRVLCRAILCKHNNTVSKTQRLIRGLCRKDRVLQGEIASMLPNTVFFRVLSIERFARLLRDENFYETVDDALAAILPLVGIPLDRLVSVLASKPLGKHLLWSSFVLEEENWEGVPDLPQRELLCSLGLKREDGPLLIFQFELPPHFKPRLPTFWDAYAASVWNRYFRVRPPGEPHGLTMPTEGCLQSARPEVVHEVVNISQLVKPIEYARRQGKQ